MENYARVPNGIMYFVPHLLMVPLVLEYPGLYGR